MQLSPDSRGSARSPTGRTTHHAEQSPDRQVRPELQPWLRDVSMPSGPSRPPAVYRPCHAERASEPRSGLRSVSVKRQCLTDPKTGTPQHDDDPAEPYTLRALACGTHHPDDLLDRRRVRRIDQPFVAPREPPVEAGQGCGRSAPAGTVQQRYRFHDVLLWTTNDNPAILAPSRRAVSARAVVTSHRWTGGGPSPTRSRDARRRRTKSSRAEAVSGRSRFGGSSSACSSR